VEEERYRGEGMKNIFLMIVFGLALASASCSKGPQGYNNYGGGTQPGWDANSLGQITQDCDLYLAGNNSNAVNNACSCYTNNVAQRYSPDDVATNSDPGIDSDLSSIVQYCASQAGLQ
jgi:hypothetical protein